MITAVDSSIFIDVLEPAVPVPAGTTVRATAEGIVTAVTQEAGFGLIGRTRIRVLGA